MIFETEYKNRPAVAVKGGNLTAVFLSLDGGKMASLKTDDGTELLEQAKGENYRPLTLDGSYIDAECSAFDDMFPTIDPCSIAGHDYLDHGEVCRIEHTAEIKAEKLLLSCIAKSVNARFSKEIYAEKNGISIKYSIENLNSKPLPYIWAGHMMFAAKKGAKVFSNVPQSSNIRVTFGKIPQNPEIIGDYSTDGESYKYYLEDAVSPLCCGIEYFDGKKVTVSFDNDTVCRLGVWMNNGSFKGMYNIALEPCTAPYDSPVNAENENVASVIEANSTVEFTMHLGYTN